VALVDLWGGVALRSHEGGLRVACGWLVGRNPLPTRWLVGGFKVALCGFNGLLLSESAAAAAASLGG
jgi:hypothetical protein